MRRGGEKKKAHRHLSYHRADLMKLFEEGKIASYGGVS